jgi:hypothetical protein
MLILENQLPLLLLQKLIAVETAKPPVNYIVAAFFYTAFAYDANNN